jgi:hypothetical protein
VKKLNFSYLMNRVKKYLLHLVLLFGCICPVLASEWSHGSSFDTRLVTEKGFEVGGVKVWNDLENLYVSVSTQNGFELHGSQMAFGSSLESIPQVPKGGADTNDFPFQEKHLWKRTPINHVYRINLADSGLEEGQKLFFAVHASVKFRKTGNNGSSHMDSGLESAWAEGFLFPGQDADSYFTWTVQPSVLLPDDPITLVIWAAFESYIDSWLSNVPDGLEITNQRYNGWCVDIPHHINQGVPYEAKVYSSYGELSGRMQSDHWDEVNYIVNHKRGGRDDIQAAIWYFIGGGGFPTSNEGQAMVNEALVHGEGFVPTLQQTLVLVVDAGDDVQLTIIELQPEAR